MKYTTLKHRWNKAVKGKPITIRMNITEDSEGNLSYWIDINGCQETGDMQGIPNLE